MGKGEADILSEIEECYSDPLWRIRNLYWIKPEEDGIAIPFDPRPEQLEVITSLIERPDEPIYIIKSRRLGMSTAIGVTMTDFGLWNDGFQGSLLDQTQLDAERKMVLIMRFAAMSMPPEDLARFDFLKRNDGELKVKVAGEEDNTASSIFAGVNARGGTNHFLWVSEWGPIAARDPKRSREIRTGALPSARRGRRVVETTWEGGKGGDLWELVKPILEQNPNAEGRVLFFPWHGDPACVKLTGEVDAETEEYFRELSERLGRQFSPEQKKWYISKKLEQGIFVKREYPSTLEEAMTAPVEGAIYGEIITRLRANGQVRPFLTDGTALVHTFWDEGSPINTVTWYAQFCGGEVRVIDCDHDLDLTPVERVARMKQKPFANLYGTHYLTHASQQTETSGKTFAGQLKDAGLENIRVVPRTLDIWTGINDLRQIMPRMVFRMPQCERGIEALENYHTRRESTSGIVRDDPVHDWSSHFADALRTLAEANSRGMIEGGGSVARQGRAKSVGLKSRVKRGFRG